MESSRARRRLFAPYSSGYRRPVGLAGRRRLERARFGGVSRSYSAPARTARYARRSFVPRAIPGYTRTAGMYGRFGVGVSQSGQIEKKFYDSALVLAASAGIASVSQATGAICLTLPQGTTASARIGQKIMIKSIQLKMSFFLPAGATASDIYHCYLILDTQTNGAHAGILDVFDAPGVIGEEMRNIANGDRFKILKHFNIRLDASAGVAAAFSGDSQQDDFYLKCNIPVTYNSTAGAIAEIKANSLFMCYGSVQGIANATGTARIRYTDR